VFFSCFDSYSMIKRVVVFSNQFMSLIVWLVVLLCCVVEIFVGL
jgi:hypothetical protein